MYIIPMTLEDLQRIKIVYSINSLEFSSIISFCFVINNVDHHYTNQ